MLRVGVIGTGGISPAHLDGYLASPDACQVVALCDSSPHKAAAVAERYGLSDAAIHEDPAQLLADGGLDLVSITTPPDTHARLTIQALEAGCHVLVEKPMAPSLEECDAMIAAAKRTGRTLAVVAQNRFRDDMMQLYGVDKSGMLGKISHVQLNSTWWRGLSYYDLWWRGTWETEGGGCLLNHAVHHIDLGLWLMGAPTAVTAVITNAQHDNSEVEDLAVSVWEYPRGLAELTASVVHHGQEHAIVVQGQSARVSQPWSVKAETSQPNGFPEAEPNATLIAEIESFVHGTPPLAHTLHTGQIADLLAALADGRSPLVTGEDGRRSVELITAMYQAAIERRTVDLPIPSDDPIYRSGGLAQIAPRFFRKSKSLREAGGDIQVGFADPS